MGNNEQNKGWQRLYVVRSERGRNGVLWENRWEVAVGNVKQQDVFYKIVCTDNGTELLVNVLNGDIRESNGIKWNKN